MLSLARRFVPIASGVLAVFILLHLLFAGYTFASDQLMWRWSEARWDSAGLAPAPSVTAEPVLQVYAARTFGWKGIFAVHTWIAFKPQDAPAYERYEVVGWRVWRGGGAVRRGGHAPDGRWAGHMPELLLDVRGPAAGPLIEQVRVAIEGYRYADRYRTWPGPNSNTFVAHIARSVPELGLELPPTAIGKDYLGGIELVAPAPSGTGYQVSLFGLAGFTLALKEGIELNFLGCTLGIDLDDLALKLPGFGRIG